MGRDGGCGGGGGGGGKGTTTETNNPRVSPREIRKAARKAREVLAHIGTLEFPAAVSGSISRLCSSNQMPSGNVQFAKNLKGRADSTSVC